MCLKQRSEKNHQRYKNIADDIWGELFGTSPIILRSDLNVKNVNEEIKRATRKHFSKLIIKNPLAIVIWNPSKIIERR